MIDNAMVVKQGGGDTPFEVTTIILAQELNSYNILQAMDAKLKYKHSCAMLYIFSDFAATTGGAYTNNNYGLIHNGTTIVRATLAQKSGLYPPNESVFTNRNYTIYDARDAAINADGSFTYRKPEATVNAPIGALCMLVEYPWVNADGTYDLTLWGE